MEGDEKCKKTIYDEIGRTRTQAVDVREGEGKGDFGWQNEGRELINLKCLLGIGNIINNGGEIDNGQN